jgi:hypothetical protein
MKTKLISSISLTLLSMLLVLSSFAQKDFSNESAYRFYPKKSGNFFPSPKSGNIISNENISKKVLIHFNKKFINATNIKWEQLDDNFLATFVRGETTTKSLFDKKGKIIYTINYFSETQLPVSIKGIVTNKYRDYKITSVAKITEDNRQIWIVKLAGKTNFVATQVENGEMEEIENFQKAN